MKKTKSVGEYIYWCSVCQQAVDKAHNEDACMESLCAEIHKAYCLYCTDFKHEEYWTGGDYSKLSENVKEADRYTARAVLLWLANKKDRG